MLNFTESILNLFFFQIAYLIINNMYVNIIVWLKFKNSLD